MAASNAECKDLFSQRKGYFLTQNRLDLQTPYPCCPICGNSKVDIISVATATMHPLWHPPLPDTMTWVRCKQCEHVFTDKFFTSAGLAELFLNANASQLAGGDVERQRALWAPVVQRVLDVMPEHAKPFDMELSWIDVGCGSGGLVFTAQEYGFDATGIDLREEAVRRILERGYKAHCAALFSVQSDSPIHVISMADLLEHTSHPVAVLLRANEMLVENGVLFVSCPNRESSGWREMDRKKTNFYWGEIEHHHNFSRKSMMWLLQQCGFVPMSYAVSLRYIACMEIIAVKASVPVSHTTLLQQDATGLTIC